MTTLLSKLDQVNRFVLSKQHLAPGTRGDDLVQVVEDICALHATSPLTPYLSLWSRMRKFRSEDLDEELYQNRSMLRVLCMRRTLHIVPLNRLPVVFQATRELLARDVQRQARRLVVQAGLCQEGEEHDTVARIYRRIEEALEDQGPSTVLEISAQVSELKIKITYNTDKPYAGEFSLGSRIVPGMTNQGILVRARPRGSRRSSLHEYAILADWLPDVDLESVGPEEARARLVQEYLAAFGPATFDDIHWWIGFSKRETKKALGALKTEVTEVSIVELGGEYLMLAANAQQLRDFVPLDVPCVSLLPCLDPYVMGYQDRCRFLDPEHRDKVFDRAGNAMPTVWVNGRIAGAWSQRKDGSVACGLFKPVGEEEQALLTGEIARLEDFLDDEYVSLPTSTPFTRALQ